MNEYSKVNRIHVTITDECQTVIVMQRNHLALYTSQTNIWFTATASAQIRRMHHSDRRMQVRQLLAACQALHVPDIRTRRAVSKREKSHPQALVNTAYQHMV